MTRTHIIFISGAVFTVGSACILYFFLFSNSYTLRTVPIHVQNVEREYLLYAPTHTNTPLPVVLVFHGGGGPLGSAELMAQYSGWKEKAQKEGFIVVFTQGTLENPSRPLNLTLGDPNRNIRLWHVGEHIPPVTHDDVDDVTYVRAILGDITFKYNVNREHIFATGFSNGATFAYRLGSEMSDTLAAIAPVAGLLYNSFPTPQTPVSLLSIVGTSDPVPPAETPGELIPVIDPPTAWAHFDHCTEPAGQKAELGVRTETFTSCASSTEVRDIYITGLAHTYPAAATDLAWDFFKSHPKKEN
ncbi:MAG: hypothetical protein NT019_00535 [Candidatus Adlerbacteria bacterium]|nr:hypothetical protein [Candidatus Adlerbacteria bacterium]